MNKRLAVLVSIITLDSVGIGLIFPILPGLLRELTHSSEISLLYGVIIAIYALMQFIFSPILGALSDRYGRRPVLLISIAGATIDYLFMAFSPVVSMLLIGRAIAGLTSANLAVATAYVADITDEQTRAKGIGFMNAGFGIGFVIGPVIGGVIGSIWLRAPFMVAAGFNALNLALTYFMLPESRVPSRDVQITGLKNPFGSIQWAVSIRALLPLILIYTLIGLIGSLPGTVWVLYGQDRYHWNGMMVGLSLAMFGVCHAGSQAFLTGPITARLGELKTVIVGVLFDSTAMIILGLSPQGWMAFALAPMFAMGGIGLPALQSLMTSEVDENKQGELQGVLASLTSLNSIVGPLVSSAAYAYTRNSFIGAVWVVAGILYVFTVPLLRAARQPATQALRLN